MVYKTNRAGEEMIQHLKVKKMFFIHFIYVASWNLVEKMHTHGAPL